MTTNNKVYGYCRISTAKQSIIRQERNIKAAYPNAIIFQETYTGTKIDGRKELEKLLSIASAGDTIVFDSVSRMSRNAAEGAELYEQLYNKGIELVFIKEPYCNTDTYKQAIEKQISANISSGNAATDEFINSIIESLNRYTMQLAAQQIEIAFEQSEKEVQDLRQRTREGLITAKANGKNVGGARDYVTKKSIESKERILKYSKSFNGSLTDKEVLQLLGIDRGTYYKYKKELKAAAEI